MPLQGGIIEYLVIVTDLILGRWQADERLSICDEVSKEQQRCFESSHVTERWLMRSGEG